MTQRPVLITGFEPYGPFDANPSQEIAHALDGHTIAAVPVSGRILPVSLDRIESEIAGLLDNLSPLLVVCLGLAPEQRVIGIERLALNLADFPLADNDGLMVEDRPVKPGGPAALTATLPVRAIEAAMLDAGIPARLSASAGTYLCNACLYHALDLAAEHDDPPPCGFIHVPFTPRQAAAIMARGGMAKTAEAGMPGGIASMALDEQIRAVEIAVETGLGLNPGS